MSIRDIIRAVSNSDLIITPRIMQWRLGHETFPLRPEVAAVVMDLMTKQETVRVGNFGGSSSGACLRYQELAALGVSQQGSVSSQLQSVYDDGHWRHLRWQADLLASGIAHTVEMNLDWPNKRARGAADAVGIVPATHPKQSWRGLEFGFELKGENSNVFRTTRDQGPGKYKRQTDRYLLLSGFDLWVIVVENKDNQEFVEWVYEPDPARLKESRDELLRLNYALDRRRLHKMIPECQPMTGPTFLNCPFGRRTGPCVQAGEWPSQRLVSGSSD